MKWLADKIIAIAKRTPYFHLYHHDGSAYMERYWLMPRWLLRRESGDLDSRVKEYFKPKSWLPFALRVHKISTIDYDRDMHNHPWSFISIVLRGGYTEKRPMFEEPRFLRCHDIESGEWIDYEPSLHYMRLPGSIALRRASDRHVISAVLPDTYTLVFQFRKVQEWGFFTPKGFVPWREYDGMKIAKNV